MEAFRKQIIEQERQRLLREHAAKLLGYLPKVLKVVNKVKYIFRVGSNRLYPTFVALLGWVFQCSISANSGLTLRNYWYYYRINSFEYFCI